MSNSTPFPIREFLAPRYWPTWAGLGLLRLVIALPFRAQLVAGQALGSLLYRLPLAPRHYARTNLRLAFPELGEAERRALLKAHYRALGMSLLEVAMSWWAPESRLRGLARVEGLEHLQAAQARGKGVILLSGHFTTLELSGRLLSLHAPFAVMYRDQKNALVDRIMVRARQRNFLAAIHRNDVRGLLRQLKDKHAVWYAPDQNYAGKQSVFAPFFGVAAATTSATARLAAASGAAVVPFFQERLPGTGGYRLVLEPALADFPGDDPAADTARVNAVIEAHVRRAPAQYLWVHRRFKTRPAGEAAIYGD